MFGSGSRRPACWTSAMLGPGQVVFRRRLQAEAEARAPALLEPELLVERLSEGGRMQFDNRHVVVSEPIEEGKHYLSGEATPAPIWFCRDPLDITDPGTGVARARQPAGDRPGPGRDEVATPRRVVYDEDGGIVPEPLCHVLGRDLPPLRPGSVDPDRLVHQGRQPEHLRGVASNAGADNGLAVSMSGLRDTRGAVVGGHGRE